MTITVLVTGGAGFIGSAVIRMLMTETDVRVVNVDKLTYAACPDSLETVAGSSRYAFEKVDICDGEALRRVFGDHRPNAVMYLAAESHVDRSIDGPMDFMTTNVVGTATLLEVARAYWNELEGAAARRFRFHHVSTDEVFGSLGAEGLFTEDSPYRPNSPYSASKAGADHLVRAWGETYGLPFIITNCSNNYGPWQFPEKLIPLMTINAVSGQSMPVYGDGSNVRDWLYVDDHARALWLAVTEGKVGESYNIGGGAERSNLDVVRSICLILDRLCPDAPVRPHLKLMKFVADRPGHDFRYAIDAAKMQTELGWHPAESFESGLEKSIRWYLDNRDWWQALRDDRYGGERLGAVSAGKGSE